MTPRPDTGQPPDFVEAVFTCKGDFYDPNFPHELELFNRNLLLLLNADNEHLIIKKVEPWNSVKVTVNIPKEAAERLKSLASHNDGAALRNMGIISLQMEGDRIISLTLSKSSALSVAHSSAQGNLNTPAQLPSTSSVPDFLTEGTSAGNSSTSNIYNRTNNSSLSPGNLGKGAMQPPTKTVASLLIPKPKPEKRQRRNPNARTSGSKSRNSKSKAAQPVDSLPTVDVKSNISPQPPEGTLPTASPILTSNVPSQCTDSEAVEASSSSEVVHPVLQDTHLSQLSKPACSLTTDLLAGRRTVNSLLTTLFKRSLDKESYSVSKSTTSLLPLSQKSSPLQTVALQSSSDETAVSAPEPIAHHQNTIPIPSADMSEDISTENSECLNAAAIENSTREQPTRSEHVSVIAKSSAHKVLPNHQTEAMNVSDIGPASSGGITDLPMDLSTTTSTQQVNSSLSPNNIISHQPADRLKNASPGPADINSDKPDSTPTKSCDHIPESSAAPPPANPLIEETSNERDTSTDDVTTCSNSSATFSPKAPPVIDTKPEEITESELKPAELVISADSSQNSTMDTPHNGSVAASCTGSAAVIASDTGVVEQTTSNELLNGVQIGQESERLSTEVTPNDENSLHGAPVSVICSTTEEAPELTANRESNETAMKVEKDCVNIDDHLKSSSQSPADIIPDPGNCQQSIVDDHGGYRESKSIPDSNCGSENDIIASLPRYDGPAQQHLTAVDHEPAENGSSTSTDSGIITGSPKSDICPTPPAVDEQHLVKPEALISQSGTDIAPDQFSPASSTATAGTTLEHVTAVTSSHDTLSIPHTANRPCVSILKTVRPVHTNVISENKYVHVVKPVTTRVMVPDHSLSAAAPNDTQRLHCSRAADTMTYLMSAQANISNVFLAAANAASASQPRWMVPASREQSQVTSSPSSSIHNVTNHIHSSSNLNKPRTSTTLLLANRKDQIVLIDNRKNVGESANKSLISPVKNHQLTAGLEKPGYIISHDHKDVASNQTITGLNKFHLNSGATTLKISQPAATKIIQSSEGVPVSRTVQSTPISIVAASGEPALTTIMSRRIAAANSNLPSANHISQSVAPESSRRVSSIPSHTTIAPPNLPGVKIINKPVAYDISLLKPTEIVTSNASLPQSSINQPVTDGKPLPSLPNSDDKPSPDVAHDPVVSGDVGSKESSNSSNAKVVLHVDTDPAASTLHTTEEKTAMVNGVTEHSSNDALGTGNISPASVSSSCAALEVQTITSEAGASDPLLPSPGQQRKSGRVRTIRSPDPDYITPTTKARKRGPRQMSEDSNTSDNAPSVKKLARSVITPISPAEAALEAVAALNAPLLANGPTSQGKRSTRSSGMADLQALPTVYRERRRSKR